MRIECAPNFRNLGGLPAADTRRIAPGLVFRSERVHPFVDSSDAAALAARGLRLVCDLRGPQEILAAPNVFWRGQGVEILEMNVNEDLRGVARLDLLETLPGETGALQMMRHTYRALPRAVSRHLEGLFSRIASGHVPMLVHCTAGKDRTGVVVAMLLAALGTPRQAIYENFLESNARLSPEVVEATHALMDDLLRTPIGEAALHALSGVREEYLDESFAVIEAEYGGVDSYLEQAGGLTPERRQQMQAILLTP